MEKQKVLSIEEVAENFSTILEMDLDQKTQVGVVKENKFVIGEEDYDYKTVEWLVPEDAYEIVERAKESYIFLLAYLRNIYDKDLIDWKDAKSIAGIQAIMAMAAEAADKLDKYLQLFQAEKGIQISESSEYKELQDFYVSKIEPKFEGKLEGNIAWQKEWRINKDAFLFDIEKEGLKDFEVLKNDTCYELFYMHDAQNDPFFDYEQIRDIKLVTDFDEDVKVGLYEDPFLQVQKLKDKDLQISSRQILNGCHPFVEKFFKEGCFFKNEILGPLLNKAIVALMLASNPKSSLRAGKIGKTSLNYFFDFQLFLEKVLNSSEYERMIAYPDPENLFFLKLIHSLCYHLFLRQGGVRQEVIGLLHRFMRQAGAEKEEEGSVFTKFLRGDEKIRKFFQGFPNGPLLKILEVLRSEEIIFEYNPLRQENIPSRLYEVVFLNKNMHVLRLPCPTKQSMVTKAEIIPEFKGFVRFLTSSSKKCLVINMQDRNSWREVARCDALEKLQRESEFEKNLTVVTLTKDSNFYHQIAKYQAIKETKTFLSEFKLQLKELEAGFFFPSKIRKEKFLTFLDDLLLHIHKYLFDSKSELSINERRVFIDIYYQFLILKLIELEKPDILCFTCKDSVDTGAIQSGFFYAFLRYLEDRSFHKEEEEFLRWLFYAPSFLIRERSVNPERLSRALSSLAYFSVSDAKRILREFSNIYQGAYLRSFITYL